MIAAIVLAAGQSRRMGQPKMLLPWGGTTVLGKVVATLASAGVDDIVVVTGASRELIEGEVARLAESGLGVRSAFNADFENGEMLSSLKAGLRAMNDSAQAALIALGDQPQAEARVARDVLTAWETRRALLVVPSFGKRRGHPWLITKDLWKNLLALEAPYTARDFLSAREKDIFYVDVNTPSILQDVDTPEDYQRFTGT
jgi:molybdenum cofactor cytidylyltransferase